MQFLFLSHPNADILQAGTEKCSRESRWLGHYGQLRECCTRGAAKSSSTIDRTTIDNFDFHRLIISASENPLWLIGCNETTILHGNPDDDDSDKNRTNGIRSNQAGIRFGLREIDVFLQSGKSASHTHRSSEFYSHISTILSTRVRANAKIQPHHRPNCRAATRVPPTQRQNECTAMCNWDQLAVRNRFSGTRPASPSIHSSCSTTKRIGHWVSSKGNVWPVCIPNWCDTLSMPVTRNGSFNIASCRQRSNISAFYCWCWTK